MRSRSPRLVTTAALVAGLTLGVVGTVGAYALVTSPGPTDGRGAFWLDRSALENVLAERAITPTGETKRFLAVAGRVTEPYDGTRDDGNAGHERHARDESLSETEAA